MKLPHADQAYIPREKLTEYLLSSSHPVGKAKAKFFRGFGYDDFNVYELEAGLLDIARTQDVAEEEQTPHGVKYRIDGSLHTPTGAVIRVRTVWIIGVQETAPRFVTAIPA